MRCGLSGIMLLFTVRRYRSWHSMPIIREAGWGTAPLAWQASGWRMGVKLWHENCCIIWHENCCIT